MIAAPSILMDTNPISEEQARRELWRSFSSLVRAYVAGAQAGFESADVMALAPTDEEIELISPTRTMRIALPSGAATGHWTIHQAPGATDDSVLAEGAFRIGLDSRVEWTGMPGQQEMDAVAEAIATLMLE